MFDAMTTRWKAALILATVAALNVRAAATNARQEGAAIDDEQMARAVLSALQRDEGTPEHMIDVEAKAGVVALSGTVHSLRAQDRACRVAETIKGVQSVVCRVHVRPVAKTDAEIKRDVSNALDQNPALSRSDLSIEVNQGEVRLTGEVDTWFEKQICDGIVKGIAGVSALADDLEVRQATLPSDTELARDIEDRIRMNVWTSGTDVSVSVTDGRAEIAGVVGSAAQKRRLVNLASLAGARSVDGDGIHVDPAKHLAMRKAAPQLNLSDEKVASAIRRSFAVDPRVDADAVKVTVNDGNVTLTGRCTALGIRDAAAQDAYHTIGVRDVENLIRVRPDRPLADEALSKRIQEALSRDADVDRLNVDVTVRNGKVYLYGVADSHYAKEQAAQAASGINGTVAVDADGLTVPERRIDKTDDQLADDVRDELWWNPFVDSDAVEVQVSNGAVTLVGKAADAHERNLATSEAYEGGARVVYNRLKLPGN